MAEHQVANEMLTLEEVDRDYGVKRATLYRYAQKGHIKIYRRGMDRRAYVRRSDIEAIRSFHPIVAVNGLTMAAIDHALELQRQIFGDRIFETPSSELIEEGRQERSDELP
jgi:predicted site-specific integrase-resolvase